MKVDGDISDTRVRQRHPFVVEATVDASELALFSRDLGGTVTDVLVAAAGRALAQAGAPVGARQCGVGVAVPTDEGVVFPVVRNAATAPLPEVRSEVARLVEAARSGRLAADDVGDAAMILDHIELGAGDVAGAVNPAECCVLAVAPQSDHGADLALALVVDGRASESAAAERLLAALVRLLERPYRRLV